jgi:N6-adenosine-specific RNA methylase IME4
MQFPNKKYNIIYADPPWTYVGTGSTTNSRGIAKSFYNTMDIEDIKALPVNDIASDNSFLFLWATETLIQEGLDVVKSWGFNYKNFAFTWIKKTSENKDFVGMGRYTRANPEICLLGIKGKVEIPDHTVRKLVYSKIREHSRKPDIIRDKIIKLCGDLPKIELFARTNIYGWDTWGNDAKLKQPSLESF